MVALVEKQKSLFHLSGHDRSVSPFELNPSMPHHSSPTTDDASPTILQQLMQVLHELRQAGHIVRIRICPQCHSPDLRLLESQFDIGGVMGLTPPKYRCPNCGYWSRVIIEATNEDINEALLDDLIRADIGTAQTLLKQLHQRKLTKDSSPDVTEP